MVGTFSEGVALGWHVFGPLARNQAFLRYAHSQVSMRLATNHVFMVLARGHVFLLLASGLVSGRLARHGEAVLRVHDRLQS